MGQSAKTSCGGTPGAFVRRATCWVFLAISGHHAQSAAFPVAGADQGFSTPDIIDGHTMHKSRPWLPGVQDMHM